VPAAHKLRRRQRISTGTGSDLLLCLHYKCKQYIFIIYVQLICDIWVVFKLKFLPSIKQCFWLSAGRKTRQVRGRKGPLMVISWGSIPVVGKFLFFILAMFIIIILFGNYVFKYDRLLYDVIFGLNAINFHEKHRFMLEARNRTIIYT